MKTIPHIKIVIFSLLVLILAASTVEAQWTQTAGPPGMSVKTFYQRGSTLFAGTSSKGVFKSSDNGVTWSPANSGIENNDVFSLFADAAFLYAGTNDGPYRSADNGVTWTPANNGMQGKFVYSLIKSNGFLYAGTISFGLFKSNDHGNTWTDANGGALGSSSIYALAFSSPNLIAMADNLIFYSTDNGNSWFIPQNSPFLFSSSSSFVVKQDSVMINTLQGVFRSFDKGQSWDPIIVIDEDISISGLVRIGKKIFAGSASKIYSTTNFGTTWTLVNAHGLRIGNHFVNEFNKSGANFLLGYEEIGVGYSADKGKHWKYSLAGFSPASTIDNAMTFSGTTLYSGTHSDGVYQSVNNGNTWTKIGTPNIGDSLSNGIVFSILKSGNIILAGCCGFGLYRSADNGVTWTHITSGLPVQTGTGFLCISGLAQSSANMLVASDEGLYYSTDNGLTWNASNVTGQANFGIGVAANGSVACAVVEATTSSNKIYRSTNSGVTWTQVFATSFDDFTCIASDGSSHFYAGTFTNNYLSNNNGVNWQSFGPGIPSGTGAFAISVLSNNVFVGNNGGVYFSDDNGASFSSENSGLDPDPNHSVQGFAISPDYVFAGTFQNAIWKRPLSDFGITKLSAGVSDHMGAEIFPNPMNHEGTLTYHLDQPGRIVINLYDGQGRVVRELLNADMEAGNYTQSIRGDDLPAGNYTLRISTGDHISVLNFEVIKE